jgi:ABC-type uncharacterized transport system substrate-binding protein
VGVLLSAGQAGVLADFSAALRRENLQLVSAIVDADAALLNPLEKILAQSDILLAIPDPRVLNSRTAQSLLLTSYRYRDPVVGYSRSLTTAGALLGLHSSPEDLGRQTAEWLAGLDDAPTLRLPAADYPRYFSVSVNAQVARSLGFGLPDATRLAAELERLP